MGKLRSKMQRLQFLSAMPGALRNRPKDEPRVSKEKDRAGIPKPIPNGKQAKRQRRSVDGQEVLEIPAHHPYIRLDVRAASCPPRIPPGGEAALGKDQGGKEKGGAEDRPYSDLLALFTSFGFGKGACPEVGSGLNPDVLPSGDSRLGDAQ